MARGRRSLRDQWTAVAVRQLLGRVYGVADGEPHRASCVVCGDTCHVTKRSAERVTAVLDARQQTRYDIGTGGTRPVQKNKLLLWVTPSTPAPTSTPARFAVCLSCAIGTDIVNFGEEVETARLECAWSDLTAYVRDGASASAPSRRAGTSGGLLCVTDEELKTYVIKPSAPETVRLTCVTGHVVPYLKQNSSPTVEPSTSLFGEVWRRNDGGDVLVNVGGGCGVVVIKEERVPTPYVDGTFIDADCWGKGSHDIVFLNEAQTKKLSSTTPKWRLHLVVHKRLPPAATATAVTVVMTPPVVVKQHGGKNDAIVMAVQSVLRKEMGLVPKGSDDKHQSHAFNDDSEHHKLFVCDETQLPYKLTNVSKADFKTATDWTAPAPAPAPAPAAAADEEDSDSDAYASAPTPTPAPTPARQSGGGGGKERGKSCCELCKEVFRERITTVARKIKRDARKAVCLCGDHTVHFGCVETIGGVSLMKRYTSETYVRACKALGLYDDGLYDEGKANAALSWRFQLSDSHAAADDDWRTTMSFKCGPACAVPSSKLHKAGVVQLCGCKGATSSSKKASYCAFHDGKACKMCGLAGLDVQCVQCTTSECPSDDSVMHATCIMTATQDELEDLNEEWSKSKTFVVTIKHKGKGGDVMQRVSTFEEFKEALFRAVSRYLQSELQSALKTVINNASKSKDVQKAVDQLFGKKYKALSGFDFYCSECTTIKRRRRPTSRTVPGPRPMEEEDEAGGGDSGSDAWAPSGDGESESDESEGDEEMDESGDETGDVTSMDEDPPRRRRGRVSRRESGEQGKLDRCISRYDDKDEAPPPSSPAVATQKKPDLRRNGTPVTFIADGVKGALVQLLSMLEFRTEAAAERMMCLVKDAGLWGFGKVTQSGVESDVIGNGPVEPTVAEEFRLAFRGSCAGCSSAKVPHSTSPVPPSHCSNNAKRLIPTYRSRATTAATDGSANCVLCPTTRTLERTGAIMDTYADGVTCCVKCAKPACVACSRTKDGSPWLCADCGKLPVDKLMSGVLAKTTVTGNKGPSSGIVLLCVSTEGRKLQSACGSPASPGCVGNRCSMCAHATSMPLYEPNTGMANWMSSLLALLGIDDEDAWTAYTAAARGRLDGSDGKYEGRCLVKSVNDLLTECGVNTAPWASLPGAAAGAGATSSVLTADMLLSQWLSTLINTHVNLCHDCVRRSPKGVLCVNRPKTSPAYKHWCGAGVSREHSRARKVAMAVAKSAARLGGAASRPSSPSCSERMPQPADVCPLLFHRVKDQPSFESTALSLLLTRREAVKRSTLASWFSHALQRGIPSSQSMEAADQQPMTAEMASVLAYAMGHINDTNESTLGSIETLFSGVLLGSQVIPALLAEEVDDERRLERATGIVTSIVRTTRKSSIDWNRIRRLPAYKTFHMLSEQQHVTMAGRMVRSSDEGGDESSGDEDDSDSDSDSDSGNEDSGRKVPLLHVPVHYVSIDNTAATGPSAKQLHKTIVEAVPVASHLTPRRWSAALASAPLYEWTVVDVGEGSGGFPFPTLAPTTALRPDATKAECPDYVAFNSDDLRLVIVRPEAPGQPAVYFTVGNLGRHTNLEESITRGLSRRRFSVRLSAATGLHVPPPESAAVVFVVTDVSAGTWTYYSSPPPSAAAAAAAPAPPPPQFKTPTPIYRNVIVEYVVPADGTVAGVTRRLDGPTDMKPKVAVGVPGQTIKRAVLITALRRTLGCGGGGGSGLVPATDTTFSLTHGANQYGIEFPDTAVRVPDDPAQPLTLSLTRIVTRTVHVCYGVRSSGPATVEVKACTLAQLKTVAGGAATNVLADGALLWAWYADWAAIEKEEFSATSRDAECDVLLVFRNNWRSSDFVDAVLGSDTAAQGALLTVNDVQLRVDPRFPTALLVAILCGEQQHDDCVDWDWTIDRQTIETALALPPAAGELWGPTTRKITGAVRRGRVAAVATTAATAATTATTDVRVRVWQAGGVFVERCVTVAVGTVTVGAVMSAVATQCGDGADDYDAIKYPTDQRARIAPKRLNLDELTQTDAWHDGGGGLCLVPAHSNACYLERSAECIDESLARLSGLWVTIPRAAGGQEYDAGVVRTREPGFGTGWQPLAVDGTAHFTESVMMDTDDEEALRVVSDSDSDSDPDSDWESMSEGEAKAFDRTPVSGDVNDSEESDWGRGDSDWYDEECSTPCTCRREDCTCHGEMCGMTCTACDVYFSCHSTEQNMCKVCRANRFKTPRVGADGESDEDEEEEDLAELMNAVVESASGTASFIIPPTTAVGRDVVRKFMRVGGDRFNSNAASGHQSEKAFVGVVAPTDVLAATTTPTAFVSSSWYDQSKAMMRRNLDLQQLPGGARVSGRLMHRFQCMATSGDADRDSSGVILSVAMGKEKIPDGFQWSKRIVSTVVNGTVQLLTCGGGAEEARVYAMLSYHMVFNDSPYSAKGDGSLEALNLVSHDSEHLIPETFPMQPLQFLNVVVPVTGTSACLSALRPSSPWRATFSSDLCLHVTARRTLAGADAGSLRSSAAVSVSAGGGEKDGVLVIPLAARCEVDGCSNAAVDPATNRDVAAMGAWLSKCDDRFKKELTEKEKANWGSDWHTLCGAYSFCATCCCLTVKDSAEFTEFTEWKKGNRSVVAAAGKNAICAVGCGTTVKVDEGPRWGAWDVCTTVWLRRRQSQKEVADDDLVVCCGCAREHGGFTNKFMNSKTEEGQADLWAFNMWSELINAVQTYENSNCSSPEVSLERAQSIPSPVVKRDAATGKLFVPGVGQSKSGVDNFMGAISAWHNTVRENYSSVGRHEPSSEDYGKVLTKYGLSRKSGSAHAVPAAQKKRKGGKKISGGVVYVAGGTLTTMSLDLFKSPAAPAAAAAPAAQEKEASSSPTCAVCMGACPSEDDCHTCATVWLQRMRSEESVVVCWDCGNNKSGKKFKNTFLPISTEGRSRWAYERWSALICAVDNFNLDEAAISSPDLATVRSIPSPIVQVDADGRNFVSGGVCCASPNTFMSAISALYKKVDMGKKVRGAREQEQAYQHALEACRFQTAYVQGDAIVDQLSATGVEVDVHMAAAAHGMCGALEQEMLESAAAVLAVAEQEAERWAWATQIKKTSSVVLEVSPHTRRCDTCKGTVTMSLFEGLIESGAGHSSASPPAALVENYASECKALHDFMREEDVSSVTDEASWMAFVCAHVGMRQLKCDAAPEEGVFTLLTQCVGCSGGGGGGSGAPELLFNCTKSDTPTTLLTWGAGGSHRGYVYVPSDVNNHRVHSMINRETVTIDWENNTFGSSAFPASLRFGGSLKRELLHLVLTTTGELNQYVQLKWLTCSVLAQTYTGEPVWRGPYVCINTTPPTPPCTLHVKTDYSGGAVWTQLGDPKLAPRTRVTSYDDDQTWVRTEWRGGSGWNVAMQRKSHTLLGGDGAVAAWMGGAAAQTLLDYTHDGKHYLHMVSTADITPSSSDASQTQLAATAMMTARQVGVRGLVGVLVPKGTAAKLTGSQPPAVVQLELGRALTVVTYSAGAFVSKPCVVKLSDTLMKGLGLDDLLVIDQHKSVRNGVPALCPAPSDSVGAIEQPWKGFVFALPPEVSVHGGAFQTACEDFKLTQLYNRAENVNGARCSITGLYDSGGVTLAEANSFLDSRARLALLNYKVSHPIVTDCNTRVPIDELVWSAPNLSTCTGCDSKCPTEAYTTPRVEENQKDVDVFATVWTLRETRGDMPMPDGPPDDGKCVCVDCVDRVITPADREAFVIWRKAIVAALVVTNSGDGSPEVHFDFVSKIPRPKFHKDGAVVGVGQTRDGVDNFLGAVSQAVNDTYDGVMEDERKALEDPRSGRSLKESQYNRTSIRNYRDDFFEQLKEWKISLKGKPRHAPAPEAIAAAAAAALPGLRAAFEATRAATAAALDVETNTRVPAPAPRADTQPPPSSVPLYEMGAADECLPAKGGVKDGDGDGDEDEDAHRFSSVSRSPSPRRRSRRSRSPPRRRSRSPPRRRSRSRSPPRRRQRDSNFSPRDMPRQHQRQQRRLLSTAHVSPRSRSPVHHEQRREQHKKRSAPDGGGDARVEQQRAGQRRLNELSDKVIGMGTRVDGMESKVDQILSLLQAQQKK